MEGQTAKAASPFGGNDASGMIRKAGKNRDLVTGIRPVLGELGGACGGRSHFRGEIL